MTHLPPSRFWLLCGFCLGTLVNYWYGYPTCPPVVKCKPYVIDEIGEKFIKDWVLLVCVLRRLDCNGCGIWKDIGEELK